MCHISWGKGILPLLGAFSRRVWGRLGVRLRGETSVEGKVKFFAFAAGEFLDEEMYYIVEKLSKHEKRERLDVQKEIQEKLSFPETSGQHPFECWGPKELADRINASKYVKVD